MLDRMLALEITRKDLRLLLRDRRALAVLVALPLVFITLLGFSTSRLLKLKPSGQPPVVQNDDARRLQSEPRAGDETSSFADASSANHNADLPHGNIDNSTVERDVNVYQSIVPSYTVLFVFFMVNVMGRSFIHEAQLGTLNRLRLAPITPLALMIGKTLPFFVISVGQTAILFLAGHFVFGMPLGNRPLLLLPVIACTSLAATSLGLLFATLVKTESQVSAYGNLIVISMAGISGCFLPRDWLSDSMQTASLVTPHAWSLIAFNDVLTNALPTGSVTGLSCLMLTLFSGLCLYFGWRRFRSIR